MYFILNILGKQFVVKKLGTSIDVPKMNQNKKQDIDVLLFKDDSGNFKIGKPSLKVDVDYSVLEGVVKGKKVRIFKKKRRKRFQKEQGQRQLYSKISVKSIKV